jgi:hypothetical protein
MARRGTVAWPWNDLQVSLVSGVCMVIINADFSADILPYSLIITPFVHLAQQFISSGRCFPSIYHDASTIKSLPSILVESLSVDLSWPVQWLLD